MAEFKPRHSMERYNHDVERGMDLFRAGAPIDVLSQMSSMWNAQSSDFGKDWVTIYVRDAITSNLLATFDVPLVLNKDDRDRYMDVEMQRLKKMYPLQSHRMLVCHE